MDISSTASLEDLVRSRGRRDGLSDPPRAIASAVSWGAIAAGAAAAAALSLILLILGVGLGLSSVSPWAPDGVSGTTFGVSTILWLTLTSLIASTMGGYLAGRLRTKWTEVHADEVYFRDTAHGFLAWAVSSLATAALLTSAIGTIVGGGVQAGASVAGGAVGPAGAAVGELADSTGLSRQGDVGPMGYFIDSLFRRDTAAAAAGASAAPGGAPGSAGASATRTAASPAPADTGLDAGERASAMNATHAAEVGRIFMNVSRTDALPADDIRYIGQIVAERTGLSQGDAERRVTEVHARAQAQWREAESAARTAADEARAASAYSALWLFVSLLLGAFVASLAATVGGRQRDA